MGVITLNTEAPTLVYRKIKGTAIIPDTEVEPLNYGKINPLDFKWEEKPIQRPIGLNCIANAKEAVKKMYESYEEDEEEMENILNSILDHAKYGLHDSRIDVEGGEWYFVEKGKEVEALTNYFKDTDPEYLGGFKRGIVVGCFESGYSRDMADRLQANEEFTTLGQAIQSHEGVLDRLVEYLIRDAEQGEYELKCLLAEQFNYYDGENAYETTIGGIDYWYFDQS